MQPIRMTSSFDDMILGFSLLLLAVLSAVTTGWMRNYAIRKRLMDVPNERSSHRSPTPRSGGVAIVATIMFGLLISYLLDRVSGSIAFTLAAGGGIVAAVGFLDDRGHVAIHLRMLVHLAAAALVLSVIGGKIALPVPWAQSGLVWLAAVLSLLWIVWLINLFNFMDGIDGIAAIESVTVMAGAAFLLWSGQQPQLALAAAIVACASSGFLILNWPPAKIFMGDVGSGYLGFMLAAMALLTNAAAEQLFWIWPILLGVFIVDATLTLIRRILRGDRFFEAHRLHAYQHAARRYHGHKPVTLAVALINIAWLLPIAWLASRQPQLGFLFTLAAWLPLGALALATGAGRLEAGAENSGHI